MNREEIKLVLKKQFSEILNHADQLGEGFKEEDVIRLKSGLRFIRSFISFIKAHKGENAMRMGEKCRHMYNVAGAIAEAQEELKLAAEQPTPDAGQLATWAGKLVAAKEEWQKSYQKSHLTKLEKQMLDYRYSGIPNDLIANFFRTHINEWQANGAQNA